MAEIRGQDRGTLRLLGSWAEPLFWVDTANRRDYSGGSVILAKDGNRDQQPKDREFSRATVNELWAEGLADVRHAVADVEWLEPRQLGRLRVYDLTR